MLAFNVAICTLMTQSPDRVPTQVSANRSPTIKYSYQLSTAGVGTRSILCALSSFKSPHFHESRGHYQIKTSESYCCSMAEFKNATKNPMPPR
ncbi:hypothetical protein BC830DRAFT_1101426 [Chytriomyces sp. MP71]|nr:hypothetical protein BC830DRAFT_1101426 [Chytriomyces sp. MP71]